MRSRAVRRVGANPIVRRDAASWRPSWAGSAWLLHASLGHGDLVDASLQVRERRRRRRVAVSRLQLARSRLARAAPGRLDPAAEPGADGMPLVQGPLIHTLALRPVRVVLE